MGQQLALQQKQQLSVKQLQSIQTGRSIVNDNEYIPKQGVLKIGINPFPNSTLIGSTINGLPIYAEKSKSLFDQITSRKERNSYFSQQQMLDLIESTVYTFTSLEQQNVLYKDISSQNIFLTQQRHINKFTPLTKFKIFPNQLIEQTTYSRLLCINKNNKNKPSYYNFSPEMIIASRAREKHFSDIGLLKKSNIFALGIVFLSTATLESSQQFYDSKSLDILQQTIQKCLIETDARYGSIMTNIIANMIDFDFEQRIGEFNELAKWIVYELDNMEPMKNKNGDKNEIKNQSDYQNEQTIPIHISFNKTKQVMENEEKIQMLPVCYKKNQQSSRINITSRITLAESQVQKQNTSSQNRIKIKIKQVPVYLQKNSNYQSDKQNRSRLIYSPFINTQKQSQFTDYTSHERSRIDIFSHTKRSLAFDESEKARKNTLRDFYGGNNICRTQR